MTPALPDLAGRTDVGQVRRENQDHFLACALEPGRTRVRNTSLPETPEGWKKMSREAAEETGGLILAAVADGVGGGPGGEQASRFALLALPEELSQVLLDPEDDRALPARLTSAVLRLHERILRHSVENPALAGMATTLTLWLGLGARAYVVQVGDSRCYRLRDGELSQLTRDQTMAQDLVDQGLVQELDEAPLGWDNILTGALGGIRADPVITTTDRRPGDVILVCSDGVMKHVSDEGIASTLAADESSDGVVTRLVEAAVAAGGTDNVTAVVLREPV